MANQTAVSQKWYEVATEKEISLYLTSKETNKGKFNWGATAGVRECADFVRTAVNIAFTIILVSTVGCLLLGLENTHWPATMITAAGGGPVLLALVLGSSALSAAVKEFKEYQKVKNVISQNLPQESTACDIVGSISNPKDKKNG